MADPYVETVNIPENVATQGFVYKSDREDNTPKFIDMSALPEGASIYYISSEATNLFHSKEVQNVVRAIKIQLEFCSHLANNVVPVESILEMHNVDNLPIHCMGYQNTSV